MTNVEYCNNRYWLLYFVKLRISIYIIIHVHVYINRIPNFSVVFFILYFWNIAAHSTRDTCRIFLSILLIRVKMGYKKIYDLDNIWTESLATPMVRSLHPFRGPVSFHSGFARARSFLSLNRKRLLTVSVMEPVGRFVRTSKSVRYKCRVSNETVYRFPSPAYSTAAVLATAKSLSCPSWEIRIRNRRFVHSLSPNPSPETADHRNVVRKTIFAKTRVNSSLHGGA